MQQQQSTVHRRLERLRYSYRHGGIGGVLFSLFYKLANRLTRLLVFRAAIVEPAAILEAHLGELDAYRHGLFTPAELLPFVDDTENDLTPEFLDYATVQGDSCYAIFDGDVLASYCWNSDKPTLIERDLYMDFRTGYTYRYKEFTRPSHRGRRLSSYNHAESLRHFAAAGERGFAGYVEANNYTSYHTLQRRNHLFPGFIVVLGRGPNPWIWLSPQARDWGFRVISTTRGMHPHGASGQGQLSLSGTEKKLRVR
jgi:hypothetical protein